ncbi:hypothetical protein Ssi03_42560 [Sphaerisporangium siamense]|nr:hypothetical protein Ssi03_42560 [Sphaerisporangium siamense]
MSGTGGLPSVVIANATLLTDRMASADFFMRSGPAGSSPCDEQAAARQSAASNVTSVRTRGVRRPAAGGIGDSADLFDTAGMLATIPGSAAPFAGIGSGSLQDR